MNSRKCVQRERLTNQRRRKGLLAQQLQERNQGLIDTIEKLNQEIALNQQIIEELLYEDPSDKDRSHEEEYADSIVKTEFSDIVSVEIFEPPPRITTTLPAIGIAAATSAKPQARKDTPTPKKRAKKDERKESFEKARAWAIDRKNAREEKDRRG
jgi:hypothetical protein